MGRLVAVGEYPTVAEASLLASLLESSGVEARLDNQNLGTLLGGYLGPAVGGVRVLVREEDADLATQVLAEHGRGGWIGEVFGGEDESEAWSCSRCGADVGGGYDACWSCGSTREGIQPSAFERVEPPPSLEGATGASEPVRAADDLARRAFWMASFGLVLLPPLLHLVSLATLVAAHGRSEPLGPAGRRWFWGALWIDLAALVATAILAAHLLRP